MAHVHAVAGGAFVADAGGVGAVLVGLAHEPVRRLCGAFNVLILCRQVLGGVGNAGLVIGKVQVGLHRAEQEHPVLGIIAHAL